MKRGPEPTAVIGTRSARTYSRPLTSPRCGHLANWNWPPTTSIHEASRQLGGGDPGKTRTSDLRFRKPSLYPAELRDREPARQAWVLDAHTRRRT
jgi:hypothetical protein